MKRQSEYQQEETKGKGKKNTFKTRVANALISLTQERAKQVLTLYLTYRAIR